MEPRPRTLQADSLPSEPLGKLVWQLMAMLSEELEKKCIYIKYIRTWRKEKKNVRMCLCICVCPCPADYTAMVVALSSLALVWLTDILTWPTELTPSLQQFVVFLSRWIDCSFIGPLRLLLL